MIKYVVFTDGSCRVNGNGSMVKEWWETEKALENEFIGK